MKTLLEYLLLEAEGENKHAPDKFNTVSLSGRLSVEAQELLGFSSYKKARKVAKEKNGEIRKKLKFDGSADTSDPIKFCKTFFKGSSKLTAYITLADESNARVQTSGGNNEFRVFLQLKNADDGSWKDVGGKGNLKSAIRVIRFWVESTMNAYLGSEGTKNIKFAYHEGSSLFCVYKKK